MDGKFLFNELAELFVNNGYAAIQKDEIYMEAVHTNGAKFDIMLEEEYLEATLNMFSDDLGLIYDIFTGEYNIDVFNDNPASRKTAAEWEKIIKGEVVRLGLEKYIEKTM